MQAEKQRAELQGELNVLNERLESATTSAQLQVGRLQNVRSYRTLINIAGRPPLKIILFTQH